MAKWALIYSAMLVFFAGGCTYQEPRIRSEPLLRFPASLGPPSAATAEPVKIGQLQFSCSEWNPWSTRFYDSMSSSFTGGSSALNECIFVSVNETDLASAMSLQSLTNQDDTIRQLMYWSDYNCNNFRARVFSFRSNVTYVGAITSGLLASTGAITALVAGPVAAGLSGASAAVISAITPLNNAYYADYTMGKLDQYIVQQRAEMRQCIEQRMAAAKPIPIPAATAEGEPAPVPASTPVSGASNCAISPAYPWPSKISDLQIYDSMCSLEILAANPMTSAAPTPQPISTPAPNATPG